MLQRLVLVLVCLGLVCSGMACAPKLVGPTASSGYFFSLQASDSTIWLGARDSAATRYFPSMTEVLVRVQDAQGQPVDGVAVTFEVEPGWVGSASVSPGQAVTRGGIAHTTVQAQLIGVVRIMARVGNTTAQTALTVLLYEESRKHE